MHLLILRGTERWALEVSKHLSRMLKSSISIVSFCTGLEDYGASRVKVPSLVRYLAEAKSVEALFVPSIYYKHVSKKLALLSGSRALSQAGRRYKCS
ncbi:hypothetical protein Desmu_0426 [Desulfurococcus mucosus DSM 2162]|uniref:Uncharacterized protein n=1 Tax=Desulfurococcus mucosus (strain ATCC 35584 / DSM 2162 / JCM 9187 / O7/1) TaxID=765177 RepID=E8R8B8_DESM0|nr:hypothetical protein Desmu_0426 [Desulfurococcus mucosus DSM 2162]